jgi:hypothetical protein
LLAPIPTIAKTPVIGTFMKDMPGEALGANLSKASISLRIYFDSHPYSGLISIFIIYPSPYGLRGVRFVIAFVATALLSLPPLMPIEGIERGQRGTCLTVFEEDTIEAFEFTVKGVMKSFLGPGKDLVLIRLEGKKPEFTGVVAGMSGSPCSIDGKLVGALAYAFASFAKEPIAGITPMKEMLKLFDQPKVQRPWRLQAQDLSRDKEKWERLASGDAKIDAASPDDELRPISTPLVMSGFHPGIRSHFSPWLRSEGFEPVASGHAPKKIEKGPPAPLKPGSAIAAVLVQGDVNIAATGTVTSVEDGKVLAFGHPFMGTGILSVPMAKARILNTMVSQRRSFKMSQTGEVIGEITQDRLTAIGGRIGPAPAMIPVTGSLQTPTGTSSFRFEVARDHSLSPRLVAMGIANSLSGAVESSGRGTLELEATVQADNMKPITIRKVFSAQRDPRILSGAAIAVARTIGALWMTPFGPPPSLSVELKVNLKPEPIVEWVESLTIDRAVARVGEPLNVSITLRREDGPLRRHHFLVSVPYSWAGRRVDIVAANGEIAQMISDQIQGQLRPTDLAGIHRWLTSRRDDGHLYLMAVRQGSGLRSKVDAMPLIPPSMVALLADAASHSTTAFGVDWEERQKVPGALFGSSFTSLKVLPKRK